MTAVTEATSKLVHQSSPILTQFYQAGIDWIPHDHLLRIIACIDITNQPEKLVTMQDDTYLIPSTSKPRNPHIFNTFANGKVTFKVVLALLPAPYALISLLCARKQESCKCT